MSYNENDYRNLLARLEELSDESYRAFSEKFIPNTQKKLGVRMPQLKILAKEILQKDADAFLAVAEDTTHEELLLQGLVIGQMKIPFYEKREKIVRFVPKIKNWAVCDSFCCAFRSTKGEKQELWEFLMPYTQSADEFSLRFAIVMLMNHFLTDDTIDQVLRIYSSIRSEAYYVRMGAAWALSVCFVKYRDKTAALLASSPLDDFTHNKTIQKICESFRVNSADKNLLRGMKRP